MHTLSHTHFINQIINNNKYSQAAVKNMLQNKKLFLKIDSYAQDITILCNKLKKIKWPQSHSHNITLKYSASNSTVVFSSTPYCLGVLYMHDVWNVIFYWMTGTDRSDASGVEKHCDWGCQPCGDLSSKYNFSWL